MKILLLGYYGVGNVGDDQMLENLLDQLSNNARVSHITVFCQENYYRVRPGVTFIEHGRFRRPAKLAALMRTDMVVWGGGTCIYEQENNSGLEGLYRLQFLCQLLGKQFIFLGVGIGTLESPAVRQLALRVLERARFIVFRDEYSLLCARSLGFRGNALLGGDLVFLFESLTPPASGIRRFPPRAISFSGLHNSNNTDAPFYAAQLAHLCEHFDAVIHFIPAHSRQLDDNVFHAEVASRLPTERVIIHEAGSAAAFLSLLSQMDFHIGMRLHSLVFADLLGVPSLGINYSPKISYYLRKSGMLPELRLSELGEPLAPERIARIAMDYSRPDHFIMQEHSAAVASLEEILTIC